MSYRFGYTGMERDEELGASHYTTLFRQYDARLGRWWSTDPIAHAWEGQYVRMGGNPVGMIDPLGLEGEGRQGPTNEPQGGEAPVPGTMPFDPSPPLAGPVGSWTSYAGYDWYRAPGKWVRGVIVSAREQEQAYALPSLRAVFDAPLVPPQPVLRPSTLATIGSPTYAHANTAAAAELRSRMSDASLSWFARFRASLAFHAVDDPLLTLRVLVRAEPIHIDRRLATETEILDASISTFSGIALGAMSGARAGAAARVAAEEVASETATTIGPVATPTRALLHQGLRSFRNSTKALEHYGKHAGSIMDVMGKAEYNLSQYISDANAVISSGTWVPELNGYVQIVGGRDKAKALFVGIDRTTGSITTFHVRRVRELMRQAPSLGWRD